jgi:hypothetical protein
MLILISLQKLMLQDRIGLTRLSRLNNFQINGVSSLSVSNSRRYSIEEEKN